MQRDGLLEGRWERSPSGPRRRVYQLGEKGREERAKILLDAIEVVHAFLEPIMEWYGIPTPRLPSFSRPDKSIGPSVCLYTSGYRRLSVIVAVP